MSATLDGKRGLSEVRAEGHQFSKRVRRLRRLEQMRIGGGEKNRLPSHRSPAQNQVAGLGERVGVMVIMNKVMHAHGIDRPAGGFAIFSDARDSEPVIGRVVEVGIAEEMSDRKYLIVDSIDGRIHYAETDKLAAPDLLEPGMMLALAVGGGKGKTRSARIEVVSFWPVERLASAEAARTLLDQVIVADRKPSIQEEGFAALSGNSRHGRNVHSSDQASDHRHGARANA